MSTEATADKPFTLDQFLAAIEERRKIELEQNLEMWHQHITGQAAHPGCYQNLNLFRDPSGVIWTHADDGGFRRHIPNPTLLDRFRLWAGWEEIITDLPEGTKQGFLEHWVWVCGRWESEAKAVEYTLTKIGVYTTYAERTRQAIVFAVYLLDPARRGELEAWFTDRARTSNRRMDAEEDWYKFFEKFGKDAGFEDCNHVHNLMVEIFPEIQRLLDTLAGQPDIIRYY